MPPRPAVVKPLGSLMYWSHMFTTTAEPDWFEQWYAARNDRPFKGGKIGSNINEALGVLVLVIVACHSSGQWLAQCSHQG